MGRTEIYRRYTEVMDANETNPLTHERDTHSSSNGK